jgi:ferritin
MAKVISDGIVKLLNYRINQEEQSSRIYLAMSIWLDNNGFTGAASLFKKYSTEELAHADKARSYLLDLNINPETRPLVAVVEDFDSLPQILEMAFRHEVDITNQCKELANACNINQDFITMNVALWYLNEQVEELAKTQLWLDKLESFGRDKIALRLLDNEMAG